MLLHLRIAMPFCILFGCCFFSQKGYAFDYNKYDKTRKQMRALTPAAPSQGEIRPAASGKSGAFEKFANRLLEAMESDIIPAKIFDTGTGVSFYFKPAKITKLGIRYKF
ncbi:MAG TPA: hypothetical protein ENK93_01050 [Campylobacteraceae bacterium]|nr:hypothetical protein [Campylobacteraceae bacterium]HHD83440.1 hypothetical protein [Campylobacteraceae bacterium]